MGAKARGKAAQHALAEVAGLDFERALAVGVDPKVIDTSHRIHWRNLTSFFGSDHSPAVVTGQRVHQYITHRRETVKAQTIRKELMTLKRGLKLAKREGWITTMLDDWPSLKSETPDERKAGKLRDPALLQAWMDLLPPEAKDEALFAAMTGLRATELKRVRPEWISRGGAAAQGGGALRLPSSATKGRYARTVGLTQAAMEVVERAKGRGPYPDGTLFGPDTRRNAYRRASVKLGVYPIITLRDLRHTFASLSLAKGADLKALMAAMGHKTMAAADLYQSTTEARAADVANVAAHSLGLKVEHKGGAQRPGRNSSARQKPVKAGT